MTNVDKVKVESEYPIPRGSIRNGLRPNSSQTFQERFCQQHGCAPKSFRRKAFFWCQRNLLLWPLAWLFWLIRPRIFRLDFRLIDLAAREQSFHEALLTIRSDDGFDPHHPQNNFIRNGLGVCLSRRKFIALAKRTFGAELTGGLAGDSEVKNGDFRTAI